MLRNVTLFYSLILFLSLQSLLQAEIKVGLLKSVESNARQIVLYNNRVIVCEPFGVIPIETMLIAPRKPKECREQIEAFGKNHPQSKSFARDRLYLNQSYHFDILEEGCVLYVNGQESYSELLLRSGLAVKDPKFDLREWNKRMEWIQMAAEKKKTGLHDSSIRESCMKEE